MRVKIIITSVLAIVSIFILPMVVAQPQEKFFLISFPEMGNQRFNKNTISLPGNNISQIQIFIPKPYADQLDYGKIFVNINGQSANRIIDKAGSTDGKLLTLNLKKVPGFILRKGNNAIEVNAHLNRGQELYDSCVLSTPYNDNGNPVATGVESFSGEKYAIIIGISDYIHVSSLRFADADARSFREFLLSPQGGGFHPENIKLLENREATLLNIKEAIDDVIRKVKSTDLLVFFLAGHGAPENGSKDNPRPPYYYVTSDTQYGKIATTALPMTLLRDKLTKEANVKRIVSFIDTCHSGGFGQDDNQLSMRNLSNDLSNQYFESSLYSEEGLAAITSSDINEVSYEDLKKWEGHGVFTYFLLRGLKGEADFDKDQIVTAGELFSYVQQQVPKSVEEWIANKAKNGINVERYKSQHPRAAISNNERLQLSIVIRPSAESRDLIKRDTPTTNRKAVNRKKRR